MATNLYRVKRTGSAVVAPIEVAPAPSGGTYVVEPTSSTSFQVARIDSAGAVSWSKSFAIPASSSPLVLSASNSTHVVVGVSYSDTSTSELATALLLLSAAGSVVWQRTIALYAESPDSIALAPDNSVYLNGVDFEYTEAALLKLNSSTGATSWTVTLRSSTDGTGQAYGGPIRVLSGGDIVVYARGPVHSGSSRAYVQRLSASDGSVSWSRAVDWLFSLSYTGLAVDGSDNIYAVGPQYVDVTYAELPVIKFASDGSTTWIRKVIRPGSGFSGSVQFLWTGLVANSSGVIIGGNISLNTNNNSGHVLVPASGSGAAVIAHYNDADGDGASAHRTSAESNDQIILTYRDPFTPALNVVAQSDGVAGSLTFGPYTRISGEYSIATGDSTVTSTSYTRASAPTISNVSATFTESAGNLITETYAPATNATATGIASTLVFGLPVAPGRVQPYTISTAYGVPVVKVFVTAVGATFPTAFGGASVLFKFPAAGTAPTAAFGTPGFNLNLSYQVEPWEVTTEFGESLALRTLPGAPNVAAFVPARVRFGTPTTALVSYGAAASFSTTEYGTPTAALALSAAGLAPSITFGAHSAVLPCGATGFSTTVFGTPQLFVSRAATGFAATVRFGLPASAFGSTGQPTGFSSTAFGLPSALKASRLTRGAKFRTAFGVAQAERTVP